MKIALEEHFITPALLDYCVKAMPAVSAEGKKRIIANLSSFDDLRLDTMDKAGIDFQFLEFQAQVCKQRVMRNLPLN
jgi:uncharacterized protein (DUF885 family)